MPPASASPEPVRVKVCGITSLGDALALEALGVDYLGFNFHRSSPRYIEPAAAAAIASRLSRARAVGIFVNEPATSLAAIGREVSLHAAQFHGGESDEEVRLCPFPVIKALPVASPADVARAQEYPSAAYLLFDTRLTGLAGGTGVAFDWSLLAAYHGKIPFFLAGGLGPGNLSEALAACRPWAVDLNSRVESAPGKKDVRLVEACLRILRGTGG